AADRCTGRQDGVRESVDSRPRRYTTLTSDHPPPLRVWVIDVAVDDVLNSPNRLSFNPIVRSHWGRHSNHPQAHRPNPVSTHYSLCERDDAEVAVLPRLYEATDAAVFRSAISKAETFGLRTLVFGGHDLEPIMPSPSVILLHPGPTR